MDNDIDKIRDFLIDDPSVILAYLFGSRVKGIINKRSDWDLGLYFSQTSLDSNPWHDFIVGAKLSQKLKAEVEIVALNRLSVPLLEFEIIKRGKLVVSKDENLRLNYENRVLRNYYDWSFFYNKHRKFHVSVPWEEAVSNDFLKGYSKKDSAYDNDK